MPPNLEAKIELNFFYVHYRDAEKFLELAEEEFTKDQKGKLISYFARHCLLSTVFASEALINKVYSEFYIGKVGDDTFKAIDKLSLPEKWLLAPKFCGVEVSTKGFDKAGNVFQTFVELVRIRNSWVHPKTGIYLDAQRLGLYISSEDDYAPDLKVLHGKNYWPHTQIPFNPFELSPKHAKLVFQNLNDLIQQLLVIFDKVFDEEWMEKLTFQIGDQLVKNHMKVHWLRGGGYTPTP
ncbi:MAG TPA: hypothetical protein VMF88_10580 [Bacteroidota bacterium]|nr:hypothetical protein [Bacteroidota bacterium]